MSLHAQFIAAPGNRPCLVWLHGFLGDRHEFQSVSPALNSWSHLFVDLPGHGAPAAPGCAGFADFSALLEMTLKNYGIDDYWLIGYSLGGRLAMYHSCFTAHQPRGLIVESGHPGLTTEGERACRRESDARWAQRFSCQPLTQVLDDWYQQPVFAGLSAAQRSALVALRASGQGGMLAAMLMATSLSCQPDLRPALAGLSCPFYYLYGERDAKFATLAGSLPAHADAIAAAGHNAHRENPQAFARRLLEILHLP